MARTLIIFGLGLIAGWILVKLASVILGIALWAGLLLIVIGVIWYLLERWEKPTPGSG